ncbi:MAG TPA: YezD family protein [Ureibacillus sp.]|nr:YezD family protein [Ureibacillus sp.]
MSKKHENVQLVLKNIEKMLTTMSYGSITLVVHEDSVVQIEKSEKIRLNK